VDIPALNSLALQSLLCLFNPKDNLFSEGVTFNEQGLWRAKACRRRSIVALLGLQRLAKSGGIHPFDLTAIREVLLRDTSWVQGVGDLGLLTWLIAECIPERLHGLFNEFNFEKILETCPDSREAHTSGLALFLAGISHAQMVHGNSTPDLTDVALDTYHLLLENQGHCGIFGCAAFRGVLQRVPCRRFGTFSDQIYAIYGLTTFAKAFQVQEPLEPALLCASSMRALQGEMGEWWFLYDKQSCRVAKRYPVFSWHQDGIAPLGLLALEEATGESFQESIQRGLAWITGANELGNDLRNWDRGVIWDSIGPRRRASSYWEAALKLVNLSSLVSSNRLSIRRELRPDHFGWLLYAFGQVGLPNEASALTPPSRPTNAMQAGCS